MISGSNPLLLNVTYIKPKTKGRGDTGECFEVIYRDDDGNMRLSYEPAEVEIYFTKPEFRVPEGQYDYIKPEERIERLDKCRVLYSEIPRAIQREIGPSAREFVRRCYENQDYDSLDKLYLWPYSFRADFLPEFYFMDEWMKKYPLPSSIKLTKGFIDIEIDQIDGFVDLDDIGNSAHCPVNCVTVILEETRESFTFVLKPREPVRLGRSEEEYQRLHEMYLKQAADHATLVENIDSFIKSLNDTFDPVYGHIEYHIRSYDEEIELIADIFRLINSRKPNFCTAWNMRFDIQYLMYRIRALGYNPADIICHPDFPDPECYFKVDRSTYMLEKQFDFFYCKSYTQYICEMRLYASIRKSQHALKSVSLNYIADRELGDRKVEYEGEMNIVDFPYLDWMKFIRYNIKDTLLLANIEKKTNDILTYYLRSMLNCTPYSKIFRETHLLRNVREIHFNKQGWIQGNNVNTIRLREEAKQRRDPFMMAGDTDSSDDDDDDDDDKLSFKGAIMADPTMNDTVGLEILGMPSNVVFINSIDLDMGAFYPSVKIFSNMDPITLIGKASFRAADGDLNDEFINGDMMNRSLNQVYLEKDKNNNLRRNDHTGEAVNTFLSKNILTFGYNWLGFPNITDLYNTVNKRIELRKNKD